VTAALDEVITLPLASSIDTLGCVLNAIPDVFVLPGWVVKASLLAVPFV
jgi:hypothetical protein